jgi:hypothetical protein
MAITEFYHYTDKHNLQDIFGLRADPDWGVGLRPIRRLIPLGQADSRQVPGRAFDAALFGLLEPLPRAWLATHWSGPERSVLEDVFHHMPGSEIARLRVMVAPGDDIHIADWGVHLRRGFNGTAVSPQAVVHRTKAAYFNSLVPLADYKPEQGYRVPELVCFSPIPPQRVKFDRLFTREDLRAEVTQAKQALKL